MLPATLPGVISISADLNSFVLRTDKTSVYYTSFEHLAKDIMPSIRKELLESQVMGSC